METLYLFPVSIPLPSFYVGPDLGAGFIACGLEGVRLDEERGHFRFQVTGGAGLFLHEMYAVLAKASQLRRTKSDWSPRDRLQKTFVGESPPSMALHLNSPPGSVFFSLCARGGPPLVLDFEREIPQDSALSQPAILLRSELVENATNHAVDEGCPPPPSSPQRNSSPSRKMLAISRTVLARPAARASALAPPKSATNSAERYRPSPSSDGANYYLAVPGGASKTIRSRTTPRVLFSSTVVPIFTLIVSTLGMRDHFRVARPTDSGTGQGRSGP